MQKAAYFDITAFMALLSGGRNVLSLVETYRDFYTGANVVAALVGLDTYLTKKRIFKTSQLRSLLRGFKILEVTREDAEKAGEILGRLKAEGKDLGIDEALVAAQCMRRGLVLVTNKKVLVDFREPELEIKQI